MARLSKNGIEINDKRIESAKQIEVNAHFKEVISEYTDIFRQDPTDELLSKRNFDFKIIADKSQAPTSL